MTLTAVVTGATGLVGGRLAAKLPGARTLSRRALPFPGAAVWRPDEEACPHEVLSGAEAVFHLAGESVAGGRWTAERKQRIVSSRVVGTRNLVAGLAKAIPRPAVLVCASAVGYYGDRGDELLDERSAGGSGFLAEVCQAWEAEALQAQRYGVRVVCLRLGLVLSSQGGVLSKLRPLFSLGLGGPLGDGRQWMPWVHLDDVVGLALHAARRHDISGAVNVVSPSPVTNQDFTLVLARALGRSARLAVPAFALKLTLGEMKELVLASQRVAPSMALRTGYEFLCPDLAEAVSRP